jgi:hypothetical protein
MWRQRVWAGLLGAALLCASALSRAECTKDTDCEGERLCEAGECVATPAKPAPAASPATIDPPRAAVAPAATGAAPTQAAVAARPLDPLPPLKRPRRNRGLMAVGIVMTSVGPLLLVTAALNHSHEGCVDGRDPTEVSCETRTEPSTYALAIGGVVFIAAGIPLIVYGAKRVPGSAPLTARAALVPWATPDAAGVRLRLEL